MTLRVDASEFSGLMREVRTFDAKLGTNLRRTIRAAAAPVLAEMRSEITGGPAKRDYGVRSAIAAGLAVRIDTPKKGSGGIRFTASPSRLPDARKPMLRLMNKQSWRHPTFGDTDHFVEQQGRPFFGSVIDKHFDRFQKAVDEALSQAAESIKAGSK